jgi:micrococcal nuclease
MSTRRRESVATLFWLLALALVLGGFWWYFSRLPATPLERPDGAQEVTVHFLEDGDSFEVAALAPGKWIPTIDPVQVRLLGIDAPEMHGEDGQPQCWAEAAKAALLRLAPFGGRLWVAGDEQLQDKYGRYLLYAWAPDGAFVNESLAGQGMVRELSIPPNYRFETEIHARIAEARAAGRGLWGACIR